MSPKMYLLEAEQPSPPLVYYREYACHQAVMSATDGGAALWVDLAGHTSPPLLRVLASASCRPPPGWRIKGESDYPVSTIKTGETLIFRIRFNPSVKRGGKRFAVWDDNQNETRESAAEKWLALRGERNGFKIIDASVLDLGWAEVRRAGSRGPNKNRPISFATATVNGRLSVSDAALFQKSLITGIGPQKAFGCGLMLVKRAGNGEQE